MNNIDIREYIKNNFKDDTLEDIKKSITDSISSHDEDPLIGLGVFFEILWNNSSDKEQETIIKNIKKGM